MPPKLKQDDPSILAAVQLYKKGHSTFQVGEMLGMCDGAIRKRLICAGVERRPVGAYKLEGFVSSTRLMNILGCAHNTVKDILARSSVEVKRSGRRVWIKEEDIEILLKEQEKDFCLKEADWEKCGVSEREMGWFGGIVDGEGSILISFSEKTGYCGSAVDVVNTSQAIIEKVKQILVKLNVGYTLTKTEPDLSRKRGRKVILRISAAGYRDQWRWLKAIRPFLVQKKRDADIVLEFCEVRSKNQRRQNGTIRETAKRLRKELVKCRGDEKRGLEDL